MKFLNFLHIAILAILTLGLPGCSSAANGDDRCGSSLKALNQRMSAEMGAIESGRIVNLRPEIARIIQSCDVSNPDVGMALAHAHSFGPSPELSARAYDVIVPRSSKEAEQVFFMAGMFAVQNHDQARAERYLAQLRQGGANPAVSDLLDASFVCEFQRCALVLDYLVALAAKRPNDLLVRALLAKSLADRHMFKEASLEFDRVLAAGGMPIIDSPTAVIAMATYFNVGRRESAADLYSRFLKSASGRLGVRSENLQLMQQILAGEDGDKFLFSEWPIAEVQSPARE